MPSKVSIKLLVEYEEPDLPSGDRLRGHFKLLKDYIKLSEIEGFYSDFEDATVTCLSIERDGERVLD